VVFSLDAKAQSAALDGTTQSSQPATTTAPAQAPAETEVPEIKPSTGSKKVPDNEGSRVEDAKSAGGLSGDGRSANPGPRVGDIQNDEGSGVGDIQNDEGLGVGDRQNECSSVVDGQVLSM
jgi:hypothetical protein